MRSTEPPIDLAIVGQGIAGTTLAWQALARGLHVVVFDDDARPSASRIAAGLVTPVTGKKLRAEPDFERLRHAAERFYSELAETLEAPLFQSLPALRLLQSTQERARWRTDADSLAPWLLAHAGAHPFAATTHDIVVAMPDAARLDCRQYIMRSRQALAARRAFVAEAVAADAVDGDGAHLAIAGRRAARVVFCRGWHDRDNPWFAPLQWRPAQGQILTVRAPWLPRAVTLHGNGVWLTPVADDTHLLGATYSWAPLDATPTAAATATLTERAQALFGREVEVLDARAAVRPIVAGRRPVVGTSPRDRRVALCNGLGSKGALYAPTIAGLLLSHWYDGADIPEQFALAARTDA